MTNEKDNGVERESTRNSQSYLDQYLGESLSVSWGGEVLNGTLKQVDYSANAAYFQPTLVSNPDGRSSYLENKFPTMVSLALLDPAQTKVMIKPLRKGYLEERVSACQGMSNTYEVKNALDNLPYKSSGKIGFGA